MFTARYNDGWMNDEEILTELATMLKALSDPNRMRIFALLMEGDSCNGELKDKLGLPPNLLSHHLRVLRQAGLVKSRRDSIDGRWIYYRVDRAKVAEWHEWFKTFFDPERIETRKTLCGPEGQLGVCPPAVMVELG